MSGLDEKLKAVWLEPEGCTLNAVADQKTLEDIKQVTGQEFYERFRIELLRYFNTVSTLEREIWQIEQIPLPALRALEAAARAAGIDMAKPSPDAFTDLSNPPNSDWTAIQQQHIDNTEQS